MLRITINGKQSAMNLRRRIPVRDWDGKTRMPKSKAKGASELCIYIETMRNKAYQAFSELSQEHDEITPEMIRNYMQGARGGKLHTIVEVWMEHNADLERAIGKECSYTLWQKHVRCLNHFRKFLMSNYRMSDMPIRHVKHKVVEDFFYYLRIDLGLKYNTAIKFLQSMKKITNRALRYRWMTMDPFEGMSLKLKETDRPYLTEEELEKIVEKKFSIERLELVKDLFVFSCYTGMSYADVRKLSKSEVEKSADGMWWIRTRRQKTKVKSQIPLLAPAKEVIDKYACLAELRSEDKLLPVMSNQKLNSYLKEIADVCGIEKKLTFHVARHTFATTVTLQNGVSIESVSRMLGHTNLKTTQHYARIVDKKIAEDMRALTQTGKMQLAS